MIEKLWENHNSPEHTMIDFMIIESLNNFIMEKYDMIPIIPTS